MLRRPALVVLLGAALAAGASPAFAQGPVRAPGAPTTSDFTTGLDQPWDLAFLPAGDALVTERGGRVRRVAADGTLGPVVLTASVRGDGEGGVLGIALDPQFAANRFVYLYETRPSPGPNQVLRYRLADDGSALVRQMVVADAIPAAGTHNGGRIRFAPDGDLYITTGDAQDLSAPRNSGSLAGKILRLGPAAYRGAGARPEVVSIGHRNPQGIAWQPGTGQLYSNEHGASGNDEVNRILPGEDYGWPDAQGPNHPPPLRSPLAVYSTIAPSGSTFVAQGGSTWSGDLLVAALRGQQIRRLRLECDRVLIDEPLFSGTFGRVRVVVEGPDGALYALTANGGGADRIVRIVPPAGTGAPAPPATCSTAAPPPGAAPAPNPATPGADGALARLTRTTEVDTYRGLTAWSAFDPAVGGYRLMLREAGALGVPAPVPPRAVAFDVDLGPDERGRTVAVYSRCAREPTRRGAGGTLLRATGRGCDLFRLDPAGGGERRIAGASTSAASEFLPSIWRGRIAFARVFERRSGRRGDLPYLYVRPLAGGASQRQPGGGRGSTGLPGPTGLDLGGTRLALSWEWRERSSLRSELRLVTLGGGRRLLERVGSARHPANVLTPSVARGRVVAGLRRVRGRSADNRIVRHRISRRERDVARPALAGMLAALGHDGTTTIAATAEDALAAPACRDADGGPVGATPGCAVVELGALRFSR